jgi:hypothetical protein
MRANLPARLGAIGMLLATLAAAALLVTRHLPQAAPPGRGHDGSGSRGHPGREPRSRAREAPTRAPTIRWRDSVAVGVPWAGSLERGVRLPAEGAHFFTWDPILKRSPNRPWRRWGTDDLLRTTLGVIRAHAADHPGAPRVGIGDLSRPQGGDFGVRYGHPGHASHQNGLDVDLYCPRLDGAERAPRGPSQVDRRLAQDLVDRFVAAGAVKIFVGPSTGLTGPPGVVQALALHDNHMHVRIED